MALPVLTCLVVPADDSYLVGCSCANIAFCNKFFAFLVEAIQKSSSPLREQHVR
jgi:hypothetical protein